MKRTAIQRRTPLKASKPLTRTTALSVSPLARSQTHANSALQRRRPKSQKRAKAEVPAKVRAALAERSDGACEIATTGCSWYATEASHRIKLGTGGRQGAARAAHDVLSNLIHGCHNCHQVRGHRNPTLAYGMGWMLREHQDPIEERVLYRGVWSWLTDDGDVLPSHLNAKEA